MSSKWLRRVVELEAAAATGRLAPAGQNVQKLLQPVPEGAAESASAARAKFDAAIPRTWAEGFAAMQHAEAPAWAALRPGMWPDLIDATGRFLHRWGARAAELGWDSVDLFGASPAAPLARVDQQGLLFFIQEGCEVVAMTAETATIRRPSGVVQTFRKPHKNARAPRTAPIWELIG
jgi:hypothetical protein